MSKQSHFWDKEYGNPQNLALSDEPAEDFLKFLRFLERHHGKKFLNVTTRALDLGCGNGRNVKYLAETYGMRGIGYDISQVAINQARENGTNLPLVYTVRSIAEPIDVEDTSVSIVLDMMTSHFLKYEERKNLREEIVRVLKPGGWLFFKSFLLDEDAHAKRLLREHPAEEEGMYMHPEIGAPEYVWTEAVLREFYESAFVIHHIEKSFKHVRKDGSAWKRRTITAYMEKVG